MSICVLVQNRQKGRCCGRESHPATMCDPEGPPIGEILDRDANQGTALKFFVDAHAGHEGQPNLSLDEALDRFDGCQLKRDVQRRMMLGEGLHDFGA